MSDRPPPYNPAAPVYTTQADNDKNNNQSGDPMKDTALKTIAGAAVAGGVVGCALAGSLVVGVAAGAGAAALATQKGTGGDIARASGNAVSATGDRLKDINEKHHVVSKTKKATAGVVKEAKKIDEKHHISKNIKKGSVKVFRATKEFDRQHQVSKKAGNAFVSGANYLTKKLAPKKESEVAKVKT